LIRNLGGDDFAVRGLEVEAELARFVFTEFKLGRRGCVGLEVELRLATLPRAATRGGPPYVAPRLAISRLILCISNVIPCGPGSPLGRNCLPADETLFAVTG
jgi:hypothetical protein